jgi:hypothetical protein
VMALKETIKDEDESVKDAVYEALTRLNA